MIYWNGPITKFVGLSLKIPLEDLEKPEERIVIKIAWGWDHMIVLLDSGEVFIAGNNAQGQLAVDPKKTPSIEDRLVYHKTINDTYNVVDIGWGSNHSVFLVNERNEENGSRMILTCGYHGWLGVSNVNEDSHKLHSVRIPDLLDYDKIEYLICKFNSSAVLDDENNLYYWGDDFDGFRERIPEKKNLFSKRIADLSFGFRHAVALLEDGRVFSWGDGTYGGCSTLNKLSETSAPVELKYFSKNNIKIVKVEAGWRHSLFLDEHGHVYGYGLTKIKNHNTERIHDPIELENIAEITDESGIKDIFAGDTESVAIDTNGIAYKWEGVTGKYELMEDVGGKYILQVVVGNQNVIILV